MTILRHIFFLIVAFTGLWTAGLVWFITLIPHWENTDASQTDAIVVLTGGSQRLERGLQLLQEGKGKRLFISGVAWGVRPPDLLKSPESKIYMPLLVLRRDDIILGFEATDTHGNAQETARWVQREHIQSLRLVTANYHMPRSLYEFHRALGGVRIVADPVFPDQFKLSEWWKFPGTLRLIISEYHKYIGRIVLGIRD